MKIRGAAMTVASLAMVGRLAAQPAESVPTVLNQPAPKDATAAQAMMLGIAHAGARLVAVGAYGGVVLSDDHGYSWRQAKSVPVSVLLTSVHFVSPTDGWATGHLGAILRTADGGETWVRQMDGITAARLIRQAAADAPAGPEGNKAQRTADQFVADGPDKPFFDLQVSTNGPGEGADVLAVGAFGMALRSHDGGNIWISAMNDVPDPEELHLYRIVGAEPVTYIVGEQGLFLVSHGTKQFDAVKVPYDGSFFGGVLSAAGTILTFGLQGKLFRSDDQGGHWAEVQTGLSNAITCGLALRDGRILLGGQGGELMLSRDDGRSFQSAARPAPAAVANMIEDGAAIIVVGPAGPARIMISLLDDGS